MASLVDEIEALTLMFTEMKKENEQLKKNLEATSLQLEANRLQLSTNSQQPTPLDENHIQSHDN